VYPYEGKTVVEGVTLHNSLQYLHGEQPYRAPDTLPFRSLVYPPAHEMALAGFLWIVGPSLYAARMFSLFCVLGAALTVGLTVRRHTKSLPASFFAGMLVICCYGLTGQWLEQVRSDALMLLLLALGTSLADRALSRNRMPLGGLIVLLLALFTKQVAIFAPAAVVFLLWFRSRRTAVIWAATFAACALAIFAAMEVWSGGWFAFYTIRVPFSAGMEFSKIDLASTFFGAVWIALWGALLVAIPSGMWKSAGLGETSPGIALWAWTLGGALVLSFVQSLKWGAALNAFVPLVPALAVLGGIALDAFLRRFKEPGWGRVAVVAAALVQVAALSYQPMIPSDADGKSQARIADWVSGAPGDVFVSVFSSQVYLHGKRYFGDDVTIGDLVRAGQWRGGQLIEKIRAGGFSVMILRPNLEPPDVAEAVRGSYVRAERIPVPGTLSHWGCMDVYVPKDAPWKPAEE
jgi:4-amino-4-deoxy-L-arabinose transferase-like glycosyltransferase